MVSVPTLLALAGTALMAAAIFLPANPTMPTVPATPVPREPEPVLVEAEADESEANDLERWAPREQPTPVPPFPVAEPVEVALAPTELEVEVVELTAVTPPSDPFAFDPEPFEPAPLAGPPIVPPDDPAPIDPPPLELAAADDAAAAPAAPDPEPAGTRARRLPVDPGLAATIGIGIGAVAVGATLVRLLVTTLIPSPSSEAPPSEVSPSEAPPSEAPACEPSDANASVSAEPAAADSPVDALGDAEAVAVPAEFAFEDESAVETESESESDDLPVAAEPPETSAPRALAWPRLVDDSVDAPDVAARLDLVEALSSLASPWAVRILREAQDDETDPSVLAAIVAAIDAMPTRLR